MALCLTTRVGRLAAAITGRERGLFAADVAVIQPLLAAGLAGKRVLVAGGAGSIGAATIQALVELRPSALAVIDPSENNLAELVRHLRSHGRGFDGLLSVQPLDYGSTLAAGWLARQEPFDLVFSFAALKHVRSERDEWSLARMLEVNLVKADRFLAACRRGGHGRDGVFLVSTDKAADPVSLMGASKRAMELLLWAHSMPGTPASLLDGGSAAPLPRVTTTRFANVLFSDGSLPWGFLQRFEKGQILAAPGDVSRYLVSPTEAGQLCLLAALACPHRHLLVPVLDPKRDQRRFTEVAEAVLRDAGFAPTWYQDETLARANLSSDRAAGRWPVLVTASDTAGEKPEEVFVAGDEVALDCGLASVRAVPAGPVDVAALTGFLRLVDQACTRGEPPPKAELARALAAVVPQLHHAETGRNLDTKV
jgi:FlaA1/EpsC-like NDP-sugar epimerase